jgi:hypothetical protein
MTLCSQLSAGGRERCPRILACWARSTPVAASRSCRICRRCFPRGAFRASPCLLSFACCRGQSRAGCLLH